MSITALAFFALALLADAASPGPTVAALVSRVLTNGFRDAVPFLLATWFGEALWLTLAVAGLAAAAKAFGPAILVARYAGAVSLLYLAWRMWTAPVGRLADVSRAPPRPWRMAAAGLLVSIGNPKNLVFYLALLPTLVDLDRVGLAGWAELTLTLLATLAAVDLSWSAAAVRARRWFGNGRAMRAANRVGASAMAGAAVAVAAR